MAEYNGINLTDCEAGKVLDPGVWGGKVQLMQDKATLGAIAVDNIACLGWLPKNARILPNSFIKFGAMGGTGTEEANPALLTIGTVGVHDKFASNVNAKTAGTFQFTSVGNSKVGEAGPIVIKITAAGSGTDVPVEAWIFYVQAG